MTSPLQAALAALSVRRWLVTAALGAIVLLLAGVALWSVHWFQPRTTQAEVRQPIETHLPLGSTVEQAIAFLGERAWLEHDHAVARANLGVVSSGRFEQRERLSETVRLPALSLTRSTIQVRSSSTGRDSLNQSALRVVRSAVPQPA